MKALQATDGHPCLVNCEKPVLQTGQVLIKVAAAGLNRADLLQVAGLYPPPPGASEVLGLECAGIIVDAGDSSRWQLGDEVCALLTGGGMAEYVAVDERLVLPVPQGLSLIEAAAVPEVYSTAWLNVFQLGQARAGEKVLLHAGASGVGSAAIQLCRAFGLQVYVSVGSAERLAYCKDLGAVDGVVRHDGVEGLAEFAPFDVILDPVGASYAQQNLKWLAFDGRWVNIGLMGGRRVELDLAQLLGKRIQLIGSTLRTRDDAFKAKLLAELEQQVWPLFAQQQLNPQLSRQYSICDAKQAFAELAGNQVNGKLVLVFD